MALLLIFRIAFALLAIKTSIFEVREIVFVNMIQVLCNVFHKLLHTFACLSWDFRVVVDPVFLFEIYSLFMRHLSHWPSLQLIVDIAFVSHKDEESVF